MKKYYAKVNYYATESSQGFTNTWDVYVFDSKRARYEFVECDDRWGTAAIKQSEVTRVAANWSMSRNEYIKPKPFTSEYWGINDYDALDRGIDGLVGIVSVCQDGTMPRLFN